MQKIYQFPKVAGTVKIDCDDLTLNNDKKYFMKAVKLVSKGSIECTTKELRTFGEYKVRKTHVARWLTTASKIVRSYMANNERNDKIKKLQTILLIFMLQLRFKLKRTVLAQIGQKFSFHAEALGNN